MWIFSFDALVQFYILMGVIFVTFVSDMSFMSVIALISVSSIGLWDWGFDPPLNCTHSNLLLMASGRASSQKLLWEQLYPREEHVWAPKQHSAWCKKGVFILTFCCDWGWFLLAFRCFDSTVMLLLLITWAARGIMFSTCPSIGMCMPSRSILHPVCHRLLVLSRFILVAEAVWY